MPSPRDKLRIAKRRPDVFQPRFELDLPGQRAQELVGYEMVAGSPYLRSGITPPWAKLTLVVRDETRADAGRGARRARRRLTSICWRRRKRSARSIASSPICRRRRRPIRICSAISSSAGDATLGSLAEIYGLSVEPDNRP